MWIARDKDGTLSFFVIRPVRYNDKWIESDASPSMQDSCTLPKLMFKEVKWEDEPLKVKLVVESNVKLKELDNLLDTALTKEMKETWIEKEKEYIKKK